MNVKKFLIIVSILLSFVLIIEVLFIFYYGRKDAIGFNSQNTSPKITPIIYKRGGNNTTSLDSLVKTDTNKTGLFVSFDYILKDLFEVRSCGDTCLQINNDSKDWLSEVNKKNIILLRGPFKMKLILENTNDLAGITINRNFTTKQGVVFSYPNIFFGLRNGGKNLYVDTKDASKIITVHVDTTFEKPLLGFYVMGDKQGKEFVVTDLDNKQLARFSTRAFNTKEQGIFPESNISLGYTIAPKSRLVIRELLIW